MRRFLVMIAAVAALWGGAMVSGASAAPSAGLGMSNPVAENPLLQDVRVFCYNRYTGQFKHWGYCRRTVYYRPVYRRPVYYYRRPVRFYRYYY